jgi:hypothetical protein
MSESKLQLPTMKREPKETIPRTLLIYSMPKAGKTTIVSQLENSLILECEPGGADFVSGQILDIGSPGDLAKAIVAIEEAGYPYEYLIVDTLTKLDEWSEIVGTYNFMDKPQGKRLNRENDDPGGKVIGHTDNRFVTVHELPNGNGYQYSRNQMVYWYNKLSFLAPHVIFLAHVKDKYLESARTGEVVESIEINLTGKVKSILASRVDAIGYLYRKDKQGILNFKNEDNVTCGGRCPHLNDEIVISEKQDDGSIKTFWDKIYKS